MLVRYFLLPASNLAMSLSSMADIICSWGLGTGLYVFLSAFIDTGSFSASGYFKMWNLEIIKLYCSSTRLSVILIVNEVVGNLLKMFAACLSAFIHRVFILTSFRPRVLTWNVMKILNVGLAEPGTTGWSKNFVWLHSTFLDYIEADPPWWNSSATQWGTYWAILSLIHFSTRTVINIK